METQQPKRRGRKPGVKQGPHVGSRPYMLLNLAINESLLFEAPKGRLAAFMAQINTDIHRNDLRGKVTQSLLLGIQPSTREVYDIVRVTRVAA